MIRKPLRKILFDAWQETINQDYANRRINSERSLQASYWSTLNKRLPVKSWRLFIEPDFRLPDSRRKHSVKPDILITNSKDIICVVELKYQPNFKPSVTKDIKSLRWIEEHSNSLVYSNKRFRGLHNIARDYEFSEQTLYVWGGVHRANAINDRSIDSPCFMNGIESFKNSYLELHAETFHNKPPRIYEKDY